MEQVIWKMFLMWTPDLYARDDKRAKNFFLGMTAVKKFKFLRDIILKDYELVYFKDKPACELSFRIILDEGFNYRGSVDAVLRHKISGEVLVLECKTTGFNSVDPAMYKNSAQAIGYSIVLDHLFEDLSSYKVLYLPYLTKTQEFQPLEFHKTFLQRALWLRELLLDVQTIEMYEEAEVYPMRGESCFSYNKPCAYFESCALSTAHLTSPCSPEMEDKKEYDVEITFQELLATQFAKADAE